eukprot:PhM_4_TR13690/c0_g1_i1/m.22964
MGCVAKKRESHVSVVCRRCVRDKIIRLRLKLRLAENEGEEGFCVSKCHQRGLEDNGHDSAREQRARQLEQLGHDLDNEVLVELVVPRWKQHHAVDEGNKRVRAVPAARCKRRYAMYGGRIRRRCRREAVARRLCEGTSELALGEGVHGLHERQRFAQFDNLAGCRDLLCLVENSLCERQDAVQAPKCCEERRRRFVNFICSEGIVVGCCTPSTILITIRTMGVRPVGQHQPRRPNAVLTYKYVFHGHQALSRESVLVLQPAEGTVDGVNAESEFTDCLKGWDVTSKWPYNVDCERHMFVITGGVTITHDARVPQHFYTLNDSPRKVEF